MKHPFAMIAPIVLCLAAASATPALAGRIPLHVERPAEGAPLTFGLPFPKGALDSGDHVRVLTPDGREVPSQVTEVSSWAPADESVKWIWVFFFSGRSSDYVLEFGPGVRRAPLAGPRVVVFNNQRANGSAEITTGPLRVGIRQGDGGFLSRVQLDADRNGFDDRDVVATEPSARGAFVDILDDAGLDPSRAVVLRTTIEKGSGPLHAILRVDGEYRYARADNRPAPFVLRIHAYAGKTYIRVLHTFVYTGIADKHRPQEGDYPHVATQADRLIKLDSSDTGWDKPDDRIAAAGLGLTLKLTGPRRGTVGVMDGEWWEDGRRRVLTEPADPGFWVFQTGPKPSRVPPLPESTPQKHLEGFAAEAGAGDRVVARTARAEGWADVSDGTRGVAIAMPRFLEEYPKEIRFDAGGGINAYAWSPRADAMSFARSNNAPGQEGAIENWAEGVAKTSEAVFFFHDASATPDQTAATMRAALEPPVAHAAPAWYGASAVWGRFAARSTAFPAFERALDYKFEWWLFNQRWMPWYGMFDYGDGKLYFNNEKWDVWSQNEPAEDFELWLQFMRTGDPRYFDAAQAFSRHAMDVDNVSWPTGPLFIGETNYPLDYWNTLKQPSGTKYLGIGHRHAPQHWTHVLSAHVWVQGWMADYYLAADHRALDQAVQTADMYLRRIWGEHGLTGRRLYLSVWNLVQVWDATKDPRYALELQDYVGRMLRLQEREQGGSLVMDRFGYANIYATHGLAEYLALTGDRRVRAALVRHAQTMRDLEPLNHQMESYLSSIHSLVLGYDLTGDASYLDAMRNRLETMKTDALPRPIDGTWTQHDLSVALEHVSHLPSDPNRPGARGLWDITNGLRVFGWTHGYTLPWALDLLERLRGPSTAGKPPAGGGSGPGR
ncbi:MAG: hypothetical protein NTY02_00605 [Acidobacteria bacterium]|nr:hypothetical protein [Acidobacteriota bacterium]